MHNLREFKIIPLFDPRGYMEEKIVRKYVYVTNLEIFLENFAKKSQFRESDYCTTLLCFVLA